jgi:hypothetical protein
MKLPSMPVSGAPLVTPGFPDHPSGHGCVSGAIVRTLRSFFGTNKVAFTAVSNKCLPTPCPTRSFAPASGGSMRVRIAPERLSFSGTLRMNRRFTPCNGLRIAMRAISRYAATPTEAMPFPLGHPDAIVRDEDEDRRLEAHLFSGTLARVLARAKEGVRHAR